MANDVRESKVESRLFDGVKRLGGRALKLTKLPGFPDRLILLPGKIAIFVELKRPRGVLAEHQELAHDILRAMDHEVEVLWDYEMVDDFLSRCSRRLTSTTTSTG
jgi:hypothetical protein